MRRLIRLAAIAVAAMTCTTAHADEPMPSVEKQHYTFRLPHTPESIQRYFMTAYLVDGNKFIALRGDQLATFGTDILDVAINPSYINYVLVSADKKENKASVFTFNTTDEEKYKFKNKKFGEPVSVTYTPDSRKILLANKDKKIHTFDARTFEVLDTIDIPMAPEHMTISSNGYYIAMTEGNNVCVYNYDTRKVRQNLKFDVPVIEARFNGDDTELAVLDADGALSIYDTRTFIIKKTIDDLDGALSFDYNNDGKYVAIATSPQKIVIINLLDTDDRDYLTIENTSEGEDLVFLPDRNGKQLLMYTSTQGIEAERMNKLSPYYGKLINDEANEMLNEWLKMMPGETMEQYNARVTDESRRKQLRLYEDEISTRYAAEMMSMTTISLGKYDRTNQMLELSFDNMPSIYLPVPEGDLKDLADGSMLELRNAKYGVMTDDKFELIYAEVYNKADGKTYTYNNLDRTPLNFMASDDNIVSIEVIQQQQMEEVKLQEIKQNVVEEAKKQDIISEHTNISVDSRIEPSYDSDGNKILNYKVKFTYQVDPEFTVTEDFAPGKYRAEQSGAASSMLQIVKQAFEGDFAQYLQPGKKVLVNISGTADATPIMHKIKYDGCYGDFVDEPVHQGQEFKGLTVTAKDGITENEQLAFLRAVGVKNYLESNVDKMKDMNADYQFYISVSEDKGSQYRRITTEFIFVDAF